MSKRKSNYYAVKIGKQPGIYKSWEECRLQVDGFCGAMYKGFRTEEEAKKYLSDNDTMTENATEVDATIYVDGSYDADSGVYGYGIVVIPKTGEVQKMYGAGDQKESAKLRNVAGEMLAAMYAVRYAINKNYNSILICYDYSGIELWATGGWKAKTNLTIQYASAMRKWSKEIDIKFKKVAAHTGVEYNELVDQLAKYAVNEFNKRRGD